MGYSGHYGTFDTRRLHYSVTISGDNGEASEFGGSRRVCSISLWNKFVHYAREQCGRLDGGGGNVRRRRYNSAARLITPERVARPCRPPSRAPPPAPRPTTDLTYEHWVNGKSFRVCRRGRANNWSSVEWVDVQMCVNDHRVSPIRLSRKELDRTGWEADSVFLLFYLFV